MGNIQCGTLVFDELGNQTKVIAVSDVMLDHDCYCVRFSDGSQMVADAEHIWETNTVRERANHARQTDTYRTQRRLKKLFDLIGGKRSYYLDVPTLKGAHRTTEEIKNTIKDGHAVKVAGGLQCNDQILPLDPYVYGIWLGDGRSDDGRIATADLEVIDNILDAGLSVNKQNQDFMYNIVGLKSVLRKMRVLGDKHILAPYLRAAKWQRLSLLQGLMDSDGYADSRGQCEFTSVSEKLADDVLELIHSLGIKAIVRIGRALLNGKDCGKKYRIKFITSEPAFRLSRKGERQKRDGFRGTHSLRYIIDVIPVSSVPVRCIVVDSPSHLYLASESMIPTHNTAWLVNEALRLSVKYPGNAGYLCRFRATDFRSSTQLQLEKFLPSEIIRVHHKTEMFYELVNGSLIFYGGLQGDEETKTKINSMELGWFGIDQAEEITEKQFLLLAGRLRLIRNGETPKYKGLLTCNPDPGWLRDRFIEEAYPDHRFVPALPKDNEKYLPDDYVDRLREIYPEAMCKRLLEGNWDVDIAGNYLIPYSEIRSAIDRGFEVSGDVVAGVDIARYGADESVFIARQGKKVIGIESWRKQDEVDSAGLIAKYIRQYKPTMTYLDAIGFYGVFDMLKNDFAVTAVNVGEGAENNKLFHNKRAEYFSRLAKRFQNEEIDIPDHPKLASQLAGLKYHYSEATRLLMEKKEDMEKSPDYADALMLAFSGGDRVHRRLKPLDTAGFDRNKQSSVVERWMGK